jgi:hypothetical protein
MRSGERRYELWLHEDRLRARGLGNASMTQPGPTEFAVQDINVDREGRVTITNPRIDGRVYAAAKRPKPKPNTNCVRCNTVKGCGGDPNLICEPNNTVQNCGCTKIA